MSSLKRKKKNTIRTQDLSKAACHKHTVCLHLVSELLGNEKSVCFLFLFLAPPPLMCALNVNVMSCSPGDEQRCVVVRGVTVILDVLSLLPHTEIVESCGSIEAHRGSFLPRKK